MIHITATGTRRAISKLQADNTLELFTELDKEHRGAVILHHGWCTGFDAYCHYAALQLGWAIRGHPPLNQKFMASGLIVDECMITVGEIRVLRVELHPPREFHARDRDMVDSSDLVVAAPLFPQDHPRSRYSGTWYTVSYARQEHVPLWIMERDGATVYETAVAS